MSLPSAVNLFETLKKDFNQPKPDLQKCKQTLDKLKLDLTKLNLNDQKDLVISRETLEIGAQLSIRLKDIPSFERYIAQLKQYYFDLNQGNQKLPPSQRMYTMLGLNLINLLSKNKIDEFHTELEYLSLDQLGNIYIKHPIEVEQCLMEGSYSKVWNSRQNVPAEEYLFFIDILMSTIRNSIASCSEKAYSSLPLADAATLLYFKTPEDVISFAKERNWVITDGKIYFNVEGQENVEIPTERMIKLALGYARELERIV
ncbi:hypothetical protein HDU92_008628 [Lobulomyces angularis]|nr:hypothetical protein HDU92_008628 [Lobulomyces angularis]